jgi:hypothetical protein
MNIGYMIVAISDNKVGYYNIDYSSGGYGYWTKTPNNAHIFTTKRLAEDVLEGTDFTREVKMTDELCNTKQKGSVSIAICEVNLSTVFVKKFNVEIKIPKSYNY